MANKEVDRKSFDLNGFYSRKRHQFPIYLLFMTHAKIKPIQCQQPKKVNKFGKNSSIISFLNSTVVSRPRRQDYMWSGSGYCLRAIYSLPRAAPSCLACWLLVVQIQKFQNTLCMKDAIAIFLKVLLVKKGFPYSSRAPPLTRSDETGKWFLICILLKSK